MNRDEIQAFAFKIIQVTTLLVGIAFTTYNLTSFKVDKFGYFFNDDNQIWLAFGLTCLALYYVIKNWKKL